MKVRQYYTTASDGASLAYWVEGTGPTVVMTNGYANSTLYWERLREQLRKNYRVVRWDLRGHGLSGGARDLESMTIEGCAQDLLRVLDAAEVERATLAGFSLGCQIVFEAWRHFPERIEGLIPILGPCERPFDTLLHPQLGPLLFRLYQQVGPRGWGPALKLGAHVTRLRPMHKVAQRIGFVGRQTSRDEMDPFYRHLGRIDAPSWYQLGLSAQEHSARDLLGEISVPTLVVAGGSDRFSPGTLGEEIATMIADSELVFIAYATHTGLFDASEEIGVAVERFLQDRVYQTELYQGRAE